ncbi:MAG: right-handed parallel beta-helix repeat-containing protein [Phycicoccus sp.]
MRRTPARLLAAAAVIGGLLAPSSASAQEAPEDFSRLEPRSTGTNYYVSGTGDDDADGLSRGTAFRTLQHASDLTRPGDTVWVMNGTYTRTEDQYTQGSDGVNSDILRIDRSGAPGAYIQYKAAPGHKPLIKLDGNYAGIQISAAYIVIQGMRVQGYNSTIDPAEATRRALLPADKVDEALYTSDFQGNGIFAFPREGRSPHHLIIRNNEVFEVPGTGIAANVADYVRVENNVSHHNNYYSPYANSGISFYQSQDIDDYTGTKFFIRNNVSYSNENKVPFWFSSTDPSKRLITDGNGIIIDDSRQSQRPAGEGTPYRGAFLIENNLMFDNGGRGVNIYESDNVTVSQNVTYRNARTESVAIGAEFQVGASSNIDVVENIMVARSDRKIFGQYLSEDLTFRDNLFLGGNGEDEFPPGVERSPGISAADRRAYADQLRLLTKATGPRR